MKTMKKSVRLALVFALVIATVFTITACFGTGSSKHKHSYTSVVTDPTCTEEGYTTYTCKCGDTYVDDYVDPAHTLVNHKAKNATCTEPGNGAYVACSKCSYSTYVATPALGHDYKSEVIKNPTMEEAGIRRYTCSRCNDTYDEEIDALSAVLPDISSAIFSIFGDVDFRLSAAKDSTIVLIEEISGGESVENYVFIAINIAEICINTKAEVPEARFILEFGMAHATINRGDEEPTVDNFDSVAAIAVFLTGDQIAFELIDLEGVTETGAYSANELFYTAVANYFGISYDELLTVVTQINDLKEYLPLIEEILSSLGTDLPEIEAGTYSVSEESNPVFTFDFETIFTTTVDENGNTVYTFNIEAIKDFITSLNDITVGEYVDSTYGEGTMDSVCEFIAGIPNMTIREIANMAIELSESYNVDIHDVYSLFEDVIYLATGTEIDIESAIEGSADLTIGEIIIANSYSSDITEEEKKEYLESVEETFGILADVIPEFNIDNIYNLYYYGDPFYSTDGEEVFSITDNLASAISSMESYVKFELVVNAEGEFVSIETKLDTFELNFDITEEGDETYCTGDIVSNGDDYLDVDITVSDGTVKDAEIVIGAMCQSYYNNDYIDSDGYHVNYLPGESKVLDVMSLTFSTVQNEDGSETLTLAIYQFHNLDEYIIDEATGELIGSRYTGEVEIVEVLKVDFTNKENGFSGVGAVSGDDIVMNVDLTESDSGVALSTNIKVAENEYFYLTFETTDGYVSSLELIIRDDFYYKSYQEVYDEEIGDYVVKCYEFSDFGEAFHISYNYENQDDDNSLNFYYEIGEHVVADDYSDASVVPNRILEVGFAHSTNSDNDVVEAYVTYYKITLALDYTNADNVERYEATISHEEEENPINAEFVIDNSVEGQVKYTIDLYDIDEDAMDFELVISGDTITYLNWIVRGNHHAYHNGELVATVPYEIFKVLYSRVEEDGNLDISFDFEQSYVHVEYEYDDFGNYVSVNAVPQVEVSYSFDLTLVNGEDSKTITLVVDETEIIFDIVDSETEKSVSVTAIIDGKKMTEAYASAVKVVVDEVVTEVHLSVGLTGYEDGKEYDFYSAELVVGENGITSIVVDFNIFVMTGWEEIYDDEGYYVGSNPINEFVDAMDIEYHNDYCGNLSFSVNIYVVDDSITIAFSTVDSIDGFTFSLDCPEFYIAVNSASTETGYKTTIDYNLNKVYVSYDGSYIYNNDPIVEIEEVENCTHYWYYMSELVKREDGVYETYDGYDIWIALDSPLSGLDGWTLNEYVEYCNDYYDNYFDKDTYNQLKALADEEGRVAVTDESVELLMNLFGYTNSWYVTYYMYYARETVSYEPPVWCSHYYYISGAGQLVIETK